MRLLKRKTAVVKFKRHEPDDLNAVATRIFKKKIMRNFEDYSLKIGRISKWKR